MRILWVSHTLFSLNKEVKSGVWQKSLALELIENTSIVLGNIAPNRNSNTLEHSTFRNIEQWGIPIYNKSQYTEYYLDIIESFQPDIIHVWGSENFLKLTPFTCNAKVPVVLFMQGVLDSIGPVLLKSLTFREALKTIGIRELITRSNIFKLEKSFVEEGVIESKMIASTKYIAVQSEWTQSQIKHLNPEAHFFKVNRALREEFLDCTKWSSFKHEHPIIYTASIGFPLKGTDILLKALSIVKQKYPNVQLRIAGAVGRKDFLADGYIRYLLKIIKKHNLKNNIVWLDSIGANDIIKNLQEASVFVNPSLIESYSLVLAEAMAVGTPSVVSYAGAMPELAEPKLEALFFTPMDYKNCASQILKILDNPGLALNLSIHAVKRTAMRNHDMSLSDAHLKIYENVLKIEKKDFTKKQ